MVDGLVETSVLFHSVTVEKGAVVRYSILMPGSVIKAGARVEYTIVAEDAVIDERAVVGHCPDGSVNWGITVVAGGVRVGPGAVVAAKAMITKDVEGEEKK